MLTGCRRAWELLRGGCCPEQEQEGMEHTRHSWERRGSASGQGCASSPWPDSRCLDTYSREARCKKKLIQPIAPVLPGEQLEGGEQPAPPRASAPALWGENPTSNGILLAGLLSRSPPSCCWDPWDSAGWAKLCYPQGVPPEHFTHGERSTKTLSGESGGEYVIGLPSCPERSLSDTKR